MDKKVSQICSLVDGLNNLKLYVKIDLEKLNVEKIYLLDMNNSILNFKLDYVNFIIGHCYI